MSGKIKFLDIAAFPAERSQDWGHHHFFCFQYYIVGVESTRNEVSSVGETAPVIFDESCA